MESNNEQQQQQQKGKETAINVEEGLMTTIGDKLKDRVGGLSQISTSPLVIPRVPERLRKGEEDAYEPFVVSIGPYHLAKPRVQPMQMHKWRFLQNLLERFPKVHLNDYIHAIASLEKRARSCYPENIGLSQSDFSEMLLLDGCFLVEYFLQRIGSQVDQCFLVWWNRSHAKYDLLLLENQIPFFILESIYQCSTKSSFTPIAIDFCQTISYHVKKDMQPPSEPIDHLLHLYHMYILWSPQPELGSFSQRTLASISKSKFGSLLSSSISSFNAYLNKKRSFSTPELPKRNIYMIPSATELNEAGVKLKAKQVTEESFLNVSFSSGVMEIRTLHISHDTNSLFRNLIAFEQLYPDSQLHFTAYVKFLNNLVNTPKDVALLYSNDIIEHPWSNDDEVVHLFTSLARHASAHPTTYLHDMYAEVDRYYKTRRHRWRATLIHDYFSSPWSLISLAAAVILVVLTFLQTYYTMYSYYHINQ